MPQKSEYPATSLAEILDRMSQKDYAVNFDVTLELATPNLRVGTVRVHGRVESEATKKK